MMSLESKRNRNIKLFPIYKMFAWDLLFYYAISFLFFTEVKGFSVADVVLVEVSLYTLFKSIFQIPSIIIIDKFGKRKSLIYANLLIGISLLVLIFCTNLTTLAISHVVMALGFVLKSLIESNFLYDSIPESDAKRKTFSKMDGKGSSLHYCLNAVSAVITGFLYLVNPYLPLVFCLMLSVFSTALSTFFYDIVVPEKHTESSTKPLEKLSTYFSDLKHSFSHIIQSSRLRALILFYGIFQSLIAVINTLDKSLLTDLGISARTFWNNFCCYFTTFWYFFFFAKLLPEKIYKSRFNFFCNYIYRFVFYCWI